MLLCFEYMVIDKLKTESRQKENLTTKLQNSNQHSNFPWVSAIGTEQPGQGATLLGWPKSIYYTICRSKMTECMAAT